MAKIKYRLSEKIVGKMPGYPRKPGPGKQRTETPRRPLFLSVSLLLWLQTFFTRTQSGWKQFPMLQS